MAPQRTHARRGRAALRGAAVVAALACAALAAAEPLSPPRGDPAARLSRGESASEYWDLVARFESGHHLAARFQITNEGPGAETAVAVGHLVHPDGTASEFHNGRRRGRWSLGPDRRSLKIASSRLDLSHPVYAFEVDSNRRGVKIHLRIAALAPAPWPDAASSGGYALDVLAVAEPVEGTVWVRGMDAPLAVRGTAGLTHTWMEQSEPAIALRRIDFFSLDPRAALFLSDLKTPAGQNTRGLLVQHGESPACRSQTYALETPGPEENSSVKSKTSEDGDYPVPPLLRLRSPKVEGEIRVGRVWLRHDPLKAIPQPFRFLLSWKMRPRRVWADSRFEVRLKASSQCGALHARGSGVTTVTFLNPVSPSA